MKTIKAVSFLVALLIVATPAAFAAVPWTGAGGAGVPDEANAGIYEASVGSVGYNSSGSTAVLLFRYVLTDTSATGIPGWTTLAVDGYDPGTSSQIRARLYKLTPGGTNSMITSCTSAAAPTRRCSPPPPARCSIPSTSPPATRTRSRWRSAAPVPPSPRSSGPSGFTNP
jgi:hypothetical protein